MTLLDFDLGRHNAGMGRIKNAVSWLKDAGQNVDPTKVAGNDTLDATMLKKWMDWMRSLQVYYSSPLDLDMMMIQAFPNAYLPNRPDSQ